MGIIDDLINKGKLKHAHISYEMVRKELEVGKKDYASAVASLEADNFKWATIQAYYAKYDLLLGATHSFRKGSSIPTVAGAPTQTIGLY